MGKFDTYPADTTLVGSTKLIAKEGSSTVTHTLDEVFTRQGQFVILAGMLRPTKTNGCFPVTTRELGANNENREAIEFPDGSDTKCWINLTLPKAYNLLVLKFKYYWFRENDEATPESKSTEIEMSAVARSNFEAIGGTVIGTAIGVVDISDSSAPAENKENISDQSGDVTIGQSVSDFDSIYVEFERQDVPASGTAMTGSLFLSKIVIEYGEHERESTG